MTASGSDDDGNPVSDEDDATVTITDLGSSILVTKTADPVSLPEPGGNASFSVTVKNTFCSRLGHDHEPLRRHLRQPGREGHV